MADEIDRAQQREERDREAALAAARSGDRMEINGACHNCGEMTDKLFCCRGCRDDWQARRDAERRNGVAA